MVVGGDPGLPAGFDDDRGVGLDQHGGAGEGIAGSHRLAPDIAGGVPVAVGIEISGECCFNLRLVAGGEGKGLLGDVGGRADGLGRDRLDDQRLVAGREAEAGAVGGGEPGLHLGHRGEGDTERGVGAFHLQHRGADGADGVGGEPLALDLGHSTGAQPVEIGGGLEAAALVQQRLDRLLAVGADVGQPHAVGAQQ